MCLGGGYAYVLGVVTGGSTVVDRVLGRVLAGVRVVVGMAGRIEVLVIEVRVRKVWSRIVRTQVPGLVSGNEHLIPSAERR